MSHPSHEDDIARLSNNKDDDNHVSSSSSSSLSSSCNWFVIQVTAIASLGGCLFGYDMGAISGALPQLTHTFDLTSNQQEWVVSILYLGGGFGAAVGGTICDKYGRHRTIVGTDVVFMVGALWLYLCQSYEGVLMGRFVVGIAVAVSGIADVSYLHELAPLEWRGAIVSVNEACISLGFLLAYIAGYIFSNHQQEDWRWIFGLAGILAMVQLIGMWTMLPESPVWLAEQGRFEESQQVWQRIYQQQNQSKDETFAIVPLSSSASAATSPTNHDTDSNILVPVDEDSARHQTSLLLAGPSSYCCSNNNNTKVQVLTQISNGGCRTLTVRRKSSKKGENTAMPIPPNAPTTTLDATATTRMGGGGDLYHVVDPPDFHLFRSFESLDQLNGSEDDVDDEGNNKSGYYCGCRRRIRNSTLLVRKCWVHGRSTLQNLQTILAKYRRQTYIALFLATTQQLCGQTNVLNYAPYIFAQIAGNNDNNNNTNNNNEQDEDNNNNNVVVMDDKGEASSILSSSTVIIGVVKFLVTVLVIWKIEQVGRRTLLLWGMSCISVGMMTLIIAFGGSTTTTSTTSYDNGGDGDEDLEQDSQENLHTVPYLALPGVLLVVCGYSMSFGPLTWLLTAELFPTEIRGRALGASTIVTYLVASLVTRTFLSASTALGGPAKVFAIYGIVTTMGIVFAYLAIPDTGDRTAEQIEDALSNMSWWRYDSILLASQVEAEEGNEVVEGLSKLQRGTERLDDDSESNNNDNNNSHSSLNNNIEMSSPSYSTLRKIT